MAHVKIVNSWGELYRMSDRNYLRYLRAGVDGKDPDASNFGKRIGVIAFTSIDAKPQDFKWTLDGEALANTCGQPHRKPRRCS